MREYTSESPEFSESIRVVEITDPAHADNVNAATEQLLQNTLRNRIDIAALVGQITEVRSAIPTSLPANGGDADTVGGKSADDLQDYNNLANRPTVGAPVYIQATAPTDTSGLWVVPPT